MGFSSDLPIEGPKDDRFGLDPFARSLASSIAKMQAPNGMVLAVNGPWGSGKSSAINLMLHHLAPEVDDTKLVIIPFNPWWFQGGDTLTLSFFQQLGAAIGLTLPKVRDALEVIGGAVSSIGAIAGAGANLIVPGSGVFVKGGAGLFGRMTRQHKSVSALHDEIAKALKAQNKRFLVIIDDIDRLNPDDVLTIFRLVKSVGRLPNVLYLLSFDRATAEKIVSERFPSEGASYLEKIVQASFDIPPAQVDVLRQEAVNGAVRVMGDPPHKQITRWWNVFMDVVAPLLRTPRDAVRIENQLAATWPSVAGNVDRADFLAITALHVAEPNLYNAIRTHPDDLCGTMEHGERRQHTPEFYDGLFGLGQRTEREARRLRVALRRLFPKLDAVWGNTYHQGDRYRRDRLVASRPNFRSYFAFSVSEEVLPAEQVEVFIERADDRTFVENELVRGLEIIRRDGTTQTALTLEELAIFAPQISEAKVHHLVAALFAAADRLDVGADQARGFSIGNNPLRLYWLLNHLVQERFPQPRREVIYRDAMEGASLGWACNFAEHCVRYFEREEGEGPPRIEPDVSQEMADSFRRVALGKLRAAAEDGSLVSHHELNVLLFTWRRLSKNSEEILAWTNRMMDKSEFILTMAASMPNEAWSQGMAFDEMGDRAARRSVYVNLDAHTDILDVVRFEQCVRELIEAASLSSDDVVALKNFMELPRGDHRGERHAAIANEN